MKEKNVEKLTKTRGCQRNSFATGLRTAVKIGSVNIIFADSFVIELYPLLSFKYMSVTRWCDTASSSVAGTGQIEENFISYIL